MIRSWDGWRPDRNQAGGLVPVYSNSMDMLKRVINSVRRNHALEHATVTLMLGRYGPMRVVGRAAIDGFYIYANVTTERLRELSHEALGRLQRGEANLAVSPLCGTNIAVTGILAGMASYVALAGRKGPLDGVSRSITAALVAAVAAQPVGRLIQKHYTTSPDLDDIEIVAIDQIGGERSRLHKVRTRPSLPATLAP
jgi:hypothetical protein